MKKKTIIAIIIASVFTVVGGVMFCTAMVKNAWDFTMLSLQKYETNTYSVDEDFKNICIDTDIDIINFEKSNSNECKIVCYETDKTKHFAEVNEETLNIGINDERKWYDYIGIMTGNPKITVYLPESEYSALNIKSTTGIVEIPEDFAFGNIDVDVSTGTVKCLAPIAENIKIRTTTGKITVSNTVVNSIDLDVTTGDILLSNIECSENVKINTTTGDSFFENIDCKNIEAIGTTGDIFLKNVLAKENFYIETDTGDIDINESDACDIHIKTDTGDVNGSLLTDKVFIVETDTGDIDVPKTTSGGKCEIKTDTGDIEICIK